jgi:hypothetical protein
MTLPRDWVRTMSGTVILGNERRVARATLGPGPENRQAGLYGAGDARPKFGFGGVHTESNQRLMYTSAWASPQ